MQAFTSISSICSHCLGSISAAKWDIKACAVTRVCRLDDTKIKAGLLGEYVRIAARKETLSYKAIWQRIHDKIYIKICLLKSQHTI